MKSTTSNHILVQSPTMTCSIINGDISICVLIPCSPDEHFISSVPPEGDVFVNYSSQAQKFITITAEYI